MIPCRSLKAFAQALVLLLAILSLAVAPTRVVWASGGGGGGEAKAEGGEAPKKKKGDEGISGGKNDGDPIYVHLQPTILPIINDHGAEQIVTMLIDLQAKDFETATKLHTNMPRLKDAIMQALYGGLADASLRNGHALDIQKIKSNILKTLDRVFGEGAVVDVLIQAVSQRKL